MLRPPRHLLLCTALPALAAFVLADDDSGALIDLEPFEVTARRTLGAESLDTRRLDPPALPTAQPLDQGLRGVAGFSLFRRSPADTSHPTSQTANLRHLAPTATSRTLVLLDGVPQNDPFGSWVAWSRYPASGLQHLAVEPGGRPTAWGNLAAGGVIRLESLDPFLETGLLQTTAGSHGTRAAEGYRSIALGPNAALAVEGRIRRHHGVHAIRADRRGIVDTREWNRHETGALRFAWRPEPDSRLDLSLRGYRERRGNGTPLQINRTDALDLSARYRTTREAGTLETLLYARRHDFRNRFTSVNPDRSAEQPVLDQFDVPGRALGFGFTFRPETDPSTAWLFGLDGQLLTGETNELFFFQDGAFTRERRAGGDQRSGGLFAIVRHRPADDFWLEVSGRLDGWQLRHGRFQEWTLPDRAELASEAFPDRSGTFPGFRVAAGSRPREGLALEAAAYRGFRIPTINELYRPFRVGNDIVQANPDLRHEEIRGADLTASWQPAPPAELRLTGFAYDLRGAITNLFLSSGPEMSPICGFVPAGGTCSQRRNIERSVVHGLSLHGAFDLTAALRFEAEHQWARSRFRRSADQPLVDGARFPQTALHRGAARLAARPANPWEGWLEVEYSSGQYDDAANTRRLAAYALLNFGLRFQAAAGLSLDLRLENLLGAEVQTGRSADGIVSIARPRAIHAGLAYSW
ncbi:MAG: TonB-dependent receptor [Puniceicoccaceae bacterium]|nr:MAG: TonB-dependent receptor [Puniceicoccaceae bacterium]